MTRLALLCLATAMLTGCGIKSGLERPDPLWGGDSARAADAERQQRLREEEQRRRQQTPQVSAPPATPLPPVSTPSTQQ